MTDERRPREFWIIPPAKDYDGCVVDTKEELSETFQNKALHVREVWSDEMGAYNQIKNLQEKLDCIARALGTAIVAFEDIRKEGQYFREEAIMDWDEVQDIAFKALAKIQSEGEK